MNFNNATILNGGAAYYVETDRLTGKTIFEADCLQCVHCAKTWKHQPGSGILRGYCNKCNGPTCGHSYCDTCYPQQQFIDDMAAREIHNRKSIEAAIRIREFWERVASE